MHNTLIETVILLLAEKILGIEMKNQDITIPMINFKTKWDTFRILRNACQKLNLFIKI